MAAPLHEPRNETTKWHDKARYHQGFRQIQINLALTDLLLADYLVVDASEPFCETSYFEIEQAMLKERVHSTCGGRWLNEDVVDFILTLYVNAGKGPRIRDGVDGPIAWSSKVRPYMAPPNPPAVASS